MAYIKEEGMKNKGVNDIKEGAMVKIASLILTDKVGELLGVISAKGKGHFGTILHRSTAKGKKLEALGMYVAKLDRFHLVEYENKGAVKQYREQTGIGPNNPSVQNEVATDIFGVYYNTKTGKLKLRVPLLKDANISKEYHMLVDGVDTIVTAEQYYAKYDELGYKRQTASVSNTGVNFRSYDLTKVVEIH